jgi:phage gpG-like protein
VDIDELPGLFQEIITRVTYASPGCAMSMADTFERQLKNVTLVMYSHAAGTRTPSPAGIGPPAMVSGDLRRSVIAWMGASGVVSTAYSGPTIFYAGIQEYGGHMSHKRFKYMHFFYDGPQWRKHVTIPERPYMGKALAAVIGNGSLQANVMAVFMARVWAGT